MKLYIVIEKMRIVRIGIFFVQNVDSAVVILMDMSVD